MVLSIVNESNVIVKILVSPSSNPTLGNSSNLDTLQPGEEMLKKALNGTAWVTINSSVGFWRGFLPVSPYGKIHVTSSGNGLIVKSLGQVFLNANQKSMISARNVLLFVGVAIIIGMGVYYSTSEKS